MLNTPPPLFLLSTRVCSKGLNQGHGFYQLILEEHNFIHGGLKLLNIFKFSAHVSNYDIFFLSLKISCQNKFKCCIKAILNNY